jgi:hypothetical protein
MSVLVAPEVVERFVAARGRRAEQELHDAVQRAEAHLSVLFGALGAGEEPDFVIDATVLDIEGVGAIKPPQLATVLLSVALRLAAARSVPTVDDDARLTRRSRPGVAEVAGAELAGLPQSEVIVSYVPHGSIVRGSTEVAIDEMLAVENRIADAIDSYRGAAIVDKSGWEWRVRIP